MLKRYRRQFILLNLCLVGAVLALMLILVGVYMYHDYYGELKATMIDVIKPLNSPMFSEGEPAQPPRREPLDVPERLPGGTDAFGGKGGKKPLLSPERRRRINTVFYTPESGRISVLSDEPIFDDDTLAAALPLIAAQSAGFGILREYGMFYYCSGGGTSYKIAVTSTAYLRDSMTSLILILTGIFAASMVLFYVISRRISLLAIRPLEEAMTREKQFVADASHDLKTPLTVILADISILQSNPRSTVGEQEKWIDSMAAAAHNMRSMIGSLLTLSAADAAQSAPKTEKVDLSDVVEQAVLQMESVAYDSAIALEPSIEPGLHINGNRDYALQVAGSLIENALKYEPPHGSVSVRLYAKRGKAVLTVTNRSALISPEDLPHIFDRFYRADKARNTARGHGLGLAIAKQMTEAMGGTISAASGAPDGTRFTVTYKLL